MAQTAKIIRNFYRDSVVADAIFVADSQTAGIAAGLRHHGLAEQFGAVARGGLARGAGGSGPQRFLIALEGDDEAALRPAPARPSRRSIDPRPSASQGGRRAASRLAASRWAGHDAGRKSRADLDARRLCGGGSHQGAAARPQRDDVQRQRRARGGGCAQTLRPRP